MCKRQDGVLGSSKMEEVWKGQFECLINNEKAWKPIVLSMDMEAGRKRHSVQSLIERR